ncbi:MAG: DNA translocase FtsK 4TM domain-containing protein [Deltaproteobacteria bacterium]|nr:DNA translocase FtsK 4TM domain-containing protein [Deltaproteobacteria bacterium]
MDERNFKRVREIYAVLFLALAVLLLLSLISYHPGDSSFNRYLTETRAPHNLIGVCGSYTADALFRLLGLTAFLLPLFFFLLAMTYFREDSFLIYPAKIISFFAFMAALAGLIALPRSDIRIFNTTLKAGGLLGDFLTQVLSRYFNPIGAGLLFILAATIATMIVIDFSLLAVTKKLAAGIFSAARGLKRYLADRKEDTGNSQEMKPPHKKTAPVIDDFSWEPKKKAKDSEPSHFDFPKTGGDFRLPPLTLLDQVEHKDTKVKRETLLANARLLESKLADFGVEGKVVEIKPGPVITMYELEPAPGVKINRITNLADDLALALKAPSVRIIAPIPGKAAVGIEVPLQERDSVQLKDVLDNDTFLNSALRLPIALGVDIAGLPVVTDLIRMPHLLIAGTTGSGKSVALNALICSILFKVPPDEVKFLMIDPKRLEFSSYEGIPHLLHPVVLDPKMAAQVLKWAVEEMERRYQIINIMGVKNIETYNRMLEKKVPEEEKRGILARLRKNGADHGLLPDNEDIALPPKLPYIVILIDELADLMLVAQRNVEESLARLAQMARAAGIHLILATQRPSVDVITGVIKANFPTRISFQVSSKVDSRTIIDQHGAEKLLGAGDMLFIPPGTSKLTRIHGAYVSDKEIERIVAFVKKQAQPAYDESIAQFEADTSAEGKKDGEFDEKYDEAVELVTDLGHASVSLVQRYMKIGYNRAARIIERMETEGVVGPSDGVKPRKVLARRIHP